MRIQEAAKRYEHVQVITAYMAEMYGERSSSLQGQYLEGCPRDIESPLHKSIEKCHTDMAYDSS